MYSVCSLNKSVSIGNSLLVKAITNSKSCSELTKPFLECKSTFFSFSGFNDIKKARNKVITAETKFVHAQKQRRQCQDKLLAIQNDLKDIHSELPKLDRGDEKYLELVTKEYEALKAEKTLLQQVKSLHEAENAGFLAFSKALSDSNDRQIERMERAKNRPLWLALLGLLTGMTGASLYNRLTSENLVGESSAEQEHNSLLEQLTEAARVQYRQTVLFLSDMQSILVDKKTKLPLRLREDEGPVEMAIDLDGIKRKQSGIDKDFELVKKLLKNAVDYRNPNYVVLAEEVSDFLEEMDGSKEWKIKKSALGTAIVASGAGFLGLAVVYLILRAVT